MPYSAVADNDVLIKGSAYRLLDLVAQMFEQPLGILGAARFVVKKRIERHPGLVDRDGAKEHWEQFLAAVYEIEPTDEELALSTDLEEAASRGSFSLDTGESQLCAVAIVRAIDRLVTGDKRAVGAIEALLPDVPGLSQLCGRLVILEQVCDSLLALVGAEELRSRVCDEPGIDKALSICFHCSSQCNEEEIRLGIESYVADVRRSAGSVLS